MSVRSQRLGLSILFLTFGLGTGIIPMVKGADPPVSPALLAGGRALYKMHCLRCHGAQGDGQGELADDLNPRPADFTSGVYKFRSTPTGTLPTDKDLFRTISSGIPGTAMGSYGDLPEDDRRALVVAVKSFSSRFAEESAGTPITFPDPRPSTPDAVEQGRRLYLQLQCAACHGPAGRGDGPLSDSLKSSDDRPIRPADLTRPRLKSGPGTASIYRTIVTGLDGTPMPSFGDSLEPSRGWDLALYVSSLTPQEVDR